MKYTLALLLLLFVGLNAWSQEVVPLRNNEVIERYEFDLQQQLPKDWRYQNNNADEEKEACNPREPGVIYLLPEQSVTKDVKFLINYFIDTTGVLRCDNCDILDFGTATLVNDTLLYTASSTVTTGMDTLRVSYCSASFDTCYTSITYRIRVNRPGRHYFPPTINLMPEETTLIVADQSLLTADLFCSEFVPCQEGDYEGRDQRKYFTTYSEPDNQFIYEAGRIGGVDSVCLRMCDVNAICDTFHFSIAIAKGMISTPFFDDFSEDTHITDEAHWLDREVFVNRTIAKNPPSIGVATFDGVDLRGRPYGSSYGKADYLTSNYIHFNGAGDYHLNYWIQPGGLADRPEEKDSLVVEFKDENGTWHQVNSHHGIPGNVSINTIAPFEFFSIPVTSEYRYDGFQFRFINYSDRQGVNDVWNLDYVRLDANPPEPFFDDIAFTKPPIYVLENYTSMPWRHLQGKETTELANSVDVGLYNHAEETLNISPTFIRIEEETTGLNALGGDIVLLNGLEANVTNQEPNNRSFPMMEFPTSGQSIWGDFLANMQDPSLDGHDRLVFNTTYGLSHGSQISGAGYEGVQRNDQVVQSTVFDNYFAYDDGTAEAAIIVTQGHQIAVQFATAAPDQLQAVQFYFPHLYAQSADNQRFVLKVWTDTLLGEPVYEHTFKAYRPDLFYDTLQGFTTYPLIDENGNPAPLDLPTGKFYIGWEQKDACQSFFCIGVGYDRNNPNAKSFAYVYDNGLGEWNPQPDYIYDGAIMMRPVVGDEAPQETAVVEQPSANVVLRLSPNPVNTSLQIHLPTEETSGLVYVIYNQLGQQIARGNDLSSPVDCTNLKEGLYYIQVQNIHSGTGNNRVFTGKFVVVR